MDYLTVAHPRRNIHKSVVWTAVRGSIQSTRLLSSQICYRGNLTPAANELILGQSYIFKRWNFIEKLFAWRWFESWFSFLARWFCATLLVLHRSASPSCSRPEVRILEIHMYLSRHRSQLLDWPPVDPDESCRLQALSMHGKSPKLDQYPQDYTCLG